MSLGTMYTELVAMIPKRAGIHWHYKGYPPYDKTVLGAFLVHSEDGLRFIKAHCDKETFFGPSLEKIYGPVWNADNEDDADGLSIDVRTYGLTDPIAWCFTVDLSEVL